MYDPPPTPPSDALHDSTTAVNSTSAVPSASNDAGKAIIIKKKIRKKRRPHIDVTDAPQQPKTSSCCASSTSSSSSSSQALLRGIRVSKNRRNPRELISSVRQKENDLVEALALPLGMSIAAFVAQVLERKDAAGETMSVNHLSKICTLAVAESLANVFGNKFDFFVRNFEKSFQSTLMTLRLINETSQNNGKPLKCLNDMRRSDLTPPIPRNEEQGSTESSGVKDCQSEAILNTISTQEQTIEEIYENVQTDLSYRELPLLDIQRNQHLVHISPGMRHLGHSGINTTMLTTMEKSVIEQSRANDLKTFEIGLLMKKMQLKETQLALNCDRNLLERFKLSMGISKASFKAEKFKTEVEDRRHAELLQTCADCLVGGLVVMLGSLGYGAYTYSYKRITEITASCTPAKDSSSSWWVPKSMSTFNSGLQTLRCQVQVISRELFGLIMIATIVYLLLQRSSSSKQSMPITFILLLLGVACGMAGYLCINTLGGSGSHWLIYWEILCSLHLFSNIFTPTLFLLLYGPITVIKKPIDRKLFPYWIRQYLACATAVLFLPMLCGFMPFASFGEWKDHFFAAH